MDNKMDNKMEIEEMTNTKIKEVLNNNPLKELLVKLAKQKHINVLAKYSKATIIDKILETIKEEDEISIYPKVTCDVCCGQYVSISVQGIYKTEGVYYKICDTCRVAYPRINKEVLNYLGYKAGIEQTFNNLTSEINYVKQELMR